MILMSAGRPSGSKMTLSQVCVAKQSLISRSSVLTGGPEIIVILLGIAESSRPGVEGEPYQISGQTGQALFDHRNVSCVGHTEGEPGPLLVGHDLLESE